MKERISEIVFSVSAITFMAYASTYAYYAGCFDYYGIPNGLLKIDANSVLRFLQGQTRLFRAAATAVLQRQRPGIVAGLANHQVKLVGLHPAEQAHGADDIRNVIFPAIYRSGHRA